MIYKMFPATAEKYFSGNYHFEKQTAVFKKLLYVLLIIKCIYWLFYFDVLFSDNSIIFIRPYSSGSVKDLAFLLCNYGNAHLNLVFILLCGVLSLILYLTRSTYAAEITLWFITLNLHNRIYSSLSGGDHLLVQLLFFNSFLCYKGSPSAMRHILHNFGALAVIAQVCIVYFLAALGKLSDPVWLGGNAALTIAGVDHFSAGNGLQWPALIYVVLNYFVIAYQLLFPVLAFFKGIRMPFLIAGIVMHLYIAFVTGLPGFAAVMLLGYVFFWPMKPANPEN